MSNPVQKYKVVNVDNNSEVFFFDHSFKSAYDHAQEYMRRNAGKFSMCLYARSTKRTGPTWLLQ